MGWVKLGGAAVAAAAMALVSGPAEAAWQRATSRHFIIYSNEDPERLRNFAVKLEKFDKVMRVTRQMDDPPVGDGNRVTIYFVDDRDDVGRLTLNDRGTVAGFYIPRAEGSIAVVPRSIGEGQSDALNSETVLFHEYTHHLMLSQIDRTPPVWLVEGFAEFMSTASILKDGSVQLGRAPQFRARGMAGREITPLNKLLKGDYSGLDGMGMDQLYGTSWLLTHFLTFEPSRRGQLATYVTAIGKGVEPLAAASSAFGDLKVLNRDLLAYLSRPKLNGLVIQGFVAGNAAVEVQALTPGGAAVMNSRIRSKVGVNRTTAEPLAVRVRAVAARFPNDLLVERTLAEAELDSGHLPAAEAAADGALKLDPRDTEAMILKGKAILRGTGADRANAARHWFVQANKIDPEDPEPLLFFFRTFLVSGGRPNANAVAALHYASDLAPQDLGLRMNSAMQYLRDGKLAEGRVRLANVAYNPHGGALSVRAREVIVKLDAADASGALQLLEKDDDAPDPKPTPASKK